MPREIHTPVGDAPVIPVLLLMVGGYFAWFGVHYFRSSVKWPSDPIKAVLTGKSLPQNASSSSDATTLAALYTGGSSSGGTGIVNASAVTGTGAGAQIAQDALKYDGASYVFGGNASSVGDWDCSSFVSYVLGHDLGRALPGGGKWGSPGYPPNSHGPVAAAYKLYGTGVSRQQVAAGDLCVWNTHVGIAISNTRMISARTTAHGTGTGTIDGDIPGETPVFRRVG